MPKIHQSIRCLVMPNKLARTRSPFSSVEAEQEYKGRLVLARQLRKQKGEQRPGWTIRYLAKNFTLSQLSQMLGSVRSA